MCGNQNKKYRWESLSETQKEHYRKIMRACLAGPGDGGRAMDEDSPQQQEPVFKRILIASNPNTPAAVLHELAMVGNRILLERIADNPRTHEMTLEWLSCHPLAEIRAAVVDNVNLPVSTLMRLAADDSADVRYRVAENHRAPLEVLHALFDDGNPYVAERAQRTLARMQSNCLIGTAFPDQLRRIAL